MAKRNNLAQPSYAMTDAEKGQLADNLAMGKVKGTLADHAKATGATAPMPSPAAAHIARQNAAMKGAGRSVKGAPVRSVADLATVIPIGKAVADSKKAADRAKKAEGSAFAERVFEAISQNLATQRGYAETLMNMDAPNRAGFRENINAKRKAARAYETTIGDTVKGLTQSQFVQLSKLVTLSYAADAGFKPATAVDMWNKLEKGAALTWDKMDYGRIMKMAVVYKNANAALPAGKALGGNGAAAIKVTFASERARKGRTAWSAADKVAKYLLSNVGVKELAIVAKMAERLAAKIKSAEAATATLKILADKYSAKPALKSHAI